jgi:preprotein translocase subunit SecD
MSKRLRFSIVLALLIVAGVFIYPTIQWYFFTPESDQQLAQSSRFEVREYARDQAEQALNELQNLALEDSDAEVPEQYQFAIDIARENNEVAGRDQPEEWTVTSVLASFQSEQAAFNQIENHYREQVQSLKDLRSRIIQLGLDLSGGMSVILQANVDSLEEELGREPSEEEISEAIDLALEVLRNRIDQFGVTEPQIREMGERRIAVDIPGDADPERINNFLRGRGSLNFHIVNQEATQQLIQYQENNPAWSPEDGIPDFVPAGSEVVPFVQENQYGIDELQRYIVIRSNVEEDGLSGEYLTDATVAQDPVTNRPTVNFTLNSEGAGRFSRLTRDNVGNSMAIVLDGKVQAHAQIQEEIPGGQVRISGFSEEEAQSISRVLRTAALPIELGIVSQQVVGPSLGQQAVNVGLRSILVGMVLVLLFMTAYYKGAGFIADFILLLNLFLILAILSVFNLTLTLTSIAGIILTVGMSVDANVIIYERIKEEYRLGKGRRAAVQAGFEKAFWTIMDANITTFIAALFLSQLGTGPIQGFAVTLSVGIITSMFTALFVSRLIFDFTTDVLRRSKLSISWSL